MSSGENKSTVDSPDSTLAVRIETESRSENPSSLHPLCQTSGNVATLMSAAVGDCKGFGGAVWIFHPQTFVKFSLAAHVQHTADTV